MAASAVYYGDASRTIRYMAMRMRDAGVPSEFVRMYGPRMHEAAVKEWPECKFAFNALDRLSGSWRDRIVSHMVELESKAQHGPRP